MSGRCRGGDKCFFLGVVAAATAPGGRDPARVAPEALSAVPADRDV
ncbi:hypothetical protein Hbl1158_03180 [Halobaculum sp. CBA1158]|nr:hypothetical protein [Halobaculum sp. CBA1158]UIP00387.1 hypothetical protein Hbl1158_03180 [Halobaculum sp. CBA1158]